MKNVPVTVLLLTLATSAPALSSDATRISWATATKGGGFQLFGDSIAEVINASDDQLKVQALATKHILKKHRHLQKMTVPAGTYKGQKEEIQSVGLWSLIMVRADLDDDSAYRLARAIHIGHDALVSRLPQGRYTQAANTVKYVPAERLHPGAAKFYKEIGLLPVSDGVVKVTPLGSHDGDFCRYDRALIFEDPDGTRLLYDAGRTVAGPDDPRLGDIAAILAAH